MAKIELSEALRRQLGPEMKMDIHWIDLRLRDGRIFRKLVVRGDRYITGRDNDPNGEGELAFGADDIAEIKRQAFFFPPLRWLFTKPPARL